MKPKQWWTWLAYLMVANTCIGFTARYYTDVTTGTIIAFCVGVATGFAWVRSVPIIK